MTIYLVLEGSVADCKFLIRNLYPANKSTEKRRVAFLRVTPCQLLSCETQCATANYPVNPLS